ncbi:MAG: mechanosensitive ion channel family protein [Thermodesulfobacteriota bacterium]|nr:mechanosensitive ion channel family protein [Thermodesulfobacteriota bacterium]
MFQEFLNRKIFQNRVEDYLVFLLVLVAGIVIITVFKRVVLRRLKQWAKTTTWNIDEFIVDIIRKMVVPIAYYGVFFLASKNLAIPPVMERVIEMAGMLLIAFLAAQALIAVASFAIRAYIETAEKGSGRERALQGLMTLIRVIVWGLATVVLLDNLGFRINTVIAGLGIGGIAVALAAQNILGDLFAYFTIMFDRPYEIGDFVIVGEYMGVVNQLGVKTTRIGSLGGEQIIMSNKDLTDSRVRNYKRMEKRRVLFRLGVTYQTPYERLKEIPGIIREIIEGIEDTVFDRAHFSSYGDFSLVFEVVYYVLGNDYNKYMDIQQEINLGIHEEFEKREIEFAYPTQTLFLEKVAQS